MSLSHWLQDGVAREHLDPRRPWGWQVERERGPSGEPVDVLTVFLVNRECPWGCLFCDLSRYTLRRGVRVGDIPAQLDLALGEVEERGLSPRWVKLYNAGSFFDRQAIPPEDHPQIARRLLGFDRVIVECHPSLVGDRVWRFAEMLEGGGRDPGVEGGGKLEVAMGLETANPAVLARQQKRINLGVFASMARHLRSRGVWVRAFVIIQPPYEDENLAADWAVRSTHFAIDNRASVVSLIPFRPAATPFPGPTVGVVEQAFEESLKLAQGRARVFLDLWDVGRWLPCTSCREERRARYERMNHGQQIEPRIRCGVCEPPASA